MTVNKAIQRYLLTSAILMIVATIDVYLGYLHPAAAEINFTIQKYRTIAVTLGFIIILSFINTPFIALTALYLLIKRRQIPLAIFALAVLAAFFMIGRMVGDAW